MGSTPEQIESVGSVAARLGTTSELVISLAGEKNLTFDWGGMPFITWETAGKVAETIRAEQAKRDSEYIAQFDRDRQIVADMEEAARVRAAERQEPGILHGVKVSLPGEDVPPWMDHPSGGSE